MSSKDKILQAIRAVDMDRVALPEIPEFPKEEADIVKAFKSTIETVKAKVIDAQGNTEIGQIVDQTFPEAKLIASTVDKIAGNYDLNGVQNPVDLKSIDLAVIKGQVGVAENGAIWVTESEFVHRVLPFITQHLIIVLNKADIVSNMHQAYRKIKIDETGFGVFIAGPSKTADIEQSLVIGAQGARSLIVIIV